MKIFALADLHLALSVAKPMHIFGAHWENHPFRIETAWRDLVAEDDLVLVPGDISWGMRFEEARADMEFVGSLPGTKIIIRGNHDYWWASLKKLREFLPPSVIPLQNNAFVRAGVGVAGSRLWADPDLNLESLGDDDRKIFERELGRFDLSLRDLPEKLDHRIVMTHFPPLALDGRCGRAVDMAVAAGCDHWVFGHMHLSEGCPDYGMFNRRSKGIRFDFVSADYLDFVPKLILEI